MALNKAISVYSSYIDYSNIGDASYRGIIGHFFPIQNLEIINYDDLPILNSENYQGMIVAGGDIINDFPYDTLNEFSHSTSDILKIKQAELFLLLNKFKGPKFAFSIGISSLQDFEKYITCFDHVFTHNHDDVRAIQKVLGSHRAHFIPDITLAYFTSKLYDNNGSTLSVNLMHKSDQSDQSDLSDLSDQSVIQVSTKKYKKCGIFLIPELIDYPALIDDIAHLISKISLTYNITFYCLNSSKIGEVSEEVRSMTYKRLNESFTSNERLKVLLEAAKDQSRIIVDSKIYTVQETIDNIADLDFVVSMPYYSHIFCIIAETPFMSISNVRTTQSLIKQAQLHNYHYNISEKSSIISDYETIKKICGDVIYESSYIKNQLTLFLQKNRNLLLNKQLTRLLQLIRIDVRKRVAEFIIDTGDYQNATRLLSNYILGYPDSPCIIDSKSSLVKNNKEGIFEIIHDTVNRLTHYGAIISAQKSVINNLNGSAILKIQNTLKNEASQDDKLVPLSIDLREYQAYKQTGWYMASEELYNISTKLRSQRSHKNIKADIRHLIQHTERNYGSIQLQDEPNGIICDMYVDRTFCWTNSYMKYQGIIPYTSPWCGFIHHNHTVITEPKLLEIPEFLQSLSTCFGLFSFSEPLSQSIRQKLSIIAPHVPVITFAYPVINPTKIFSIENYVTNPEKQLLGMALHTTLTPQTHKPFSIYKLQNIPLLTKAIIINDNFIEYILPHTFTINSLLIQTSELIQTNQTNQTKISSLLNGQLLNVSKLSSKNSLKNETLHYNQPIESQVTKLEPITQLHVPESPLQQLSVTESSLQQLSVTESSLQQLSVTESSPQELSVTESSLQELTVTELSVTESSLQQSSVEELHIVDSSVTELSVTELPVTQSLVEESLVKELHVEESSVEDPRSSTELLLFDADLILPLSAKYNPCSMVPPSIDLLSCDFDNSFPDIGSMLIPTKLTIQPTELIDPIRIESTQTIEKETMTTNKNSVNDVIETEAADDETHSRYNKSEPGIYPEWIQMITEWLIENGTEVNFNVKKSNQIDDLNKKISDMINGVKVVEYKSNIEYDDLLSKNILFLDILDGGSVGSVIECIVRHTPVIVNKIPGTVAILGEQYPLYYNDIREVEDLVSEEKIKQAYEYLKRLDVKRYEIQYFINRMIEVITKLDEKNIIH